MLVPSIRVEYKRAGYRYGFIFPIGTPQRHVVKCEQTPCIEIARTKRTQTAVYSSKPLYIKVYSML